MVARLKRKRVLQGIQVWLASSVCLSTNFTEASTSVVSVLYKRTYGKCSLRGCMRFKNSNPNIFVNKSLNPREIAKLIMPGN